MESLLNLLIVLVVAVDLFVGLQVYQQNQDAAVIVPVAAVGAVAPVIIPASGGGGSTSGGGAGGTGPEGAVATAGVVTARNTVQSAVLAAQLFFVENTAMPSDSFAMQGLVPGPRFVDGVERASTGVIGIVATPTTILFVTAVSESQWICAAIDGPTETTQYASADTRDELAAVSQCIGNVGDWG